MKTLLKFLLILFINLSFAQEEVYEIKSSSINSAYAEFGTIYLKNNSVLFASSKKNVHDKSFTKNRRKKNKQLHLELYKGQLSDAQDITESERFKNEVKSKVFEADITFTPDYKTVFFTWNNFYDTKKLDSAKWMTLRIVRASMDENLNISNISNLPFNSSEYSVRNPCVSADGKQLFFSSDMPNGYGDTDIYVVDLHPDGSYGKPKNLGPDINTKNDELFPFIDKNNTLYFSSYGHRGKGGLDIYKSRYKNGHFEKPTNLPEPINSEYDEFAFVIDNNTNTGFFTSSRITGIGDVDIYSFKMNNKLCEQVLTANIIDENSGITLENVNISLYSNSQLVQTKIIDGTISFDLQCNQQYRIILQKENYQKKEIAFKTNTASSPSDNKTIRLTALKCDQRISVTIVNQVNKTPISGAKIVIYKDDEILEELQVSENGTFSYKIYCDSPYKIVASHNNYLSGSLAFSRSVSSQVKPAFKMFLKPLDEFITVQNQKMLKLLPLYFELDKTSINAQSAIELDKVVRILNKYPSMKIEIKTHTDSRGNDNYNFNLSGSRAKSTKDYIVLKGIEPSRILSRGYGESELINKCSNGVRCTENEHQQNRRTEFIVLKN